MKLIALEGTCPVALGAPKGMDDEFTPIDSDGAQLIISVAMKGEARPLYICCQGSLTDVASALLLKPEIADDTGRFLCEVED